jgi:NitT/TauT family transport system ATP-binding protein
MVFQHFGLFPWKTVFDNVAYGLRVQGRPDQENRATVSQYIELVGLQGFERHYPYQLSGGMQQRVNLARALAADPAVLLMDEPFAALDAQTREFMQSELLKIWAKARKTVVFITHQINEAIYLADRVIIFCARPGRVKDALKLDLPRPRGLAVKRSQEFLKYEDYVWNQIEEEVNKTMVADQVVHNIDA